MKTVSKKEKIVTPEDLDGPMMVWPRTPLSPEDEKKGRAWEAERKAAWLAKTGGDNISKKKKA